MMNKKETNERDSDRRFKAIQIICSILVAIAIWLYVDEDKALSVSMRVHDLSVEFANEDTVLAEKDLMLLSGYDTKVDLTLKGPRNVLWKLNKDEIRIVADTAAIQDTGAQSLNYEVKFSNNVQASQIQVEWASLYAITVTVGELYTKEVPIVCDVTGSVANGYVAEAFTLEPAQLALRARRDDLLNVKYAKVTLDISGAKETVIQTVDFQLYDDNDMLITNDNIRSAVKQIRVTQPVKTVKTVPLLLNFVEVTGSTMQQVDYSIDPESVQLKGDEVILDDIESIVLDTIYLQDLTEYQTLSYDIPVPDGVELLGDTTEATVTIVVEGVSERRIGVSNFSCSNVPAGYEGSVITEVLQVNLRGLTTEINALGSDNLEVIADLSGITEAGSFTVPAQIRINGYQNVGVKGNYQVIVNVVLAETPQQPEGRMIPGPGTEENNTDGEEINAGQTA